MTPVFISRGGIKLGHFYRQTSMGIDKEYKQSFITLVDQILTSKQKDPRVDTSALEKQIDQLVYKLYGLTEEEIKIVENL